MFKDKVTLKQLPGDNPLSTQNVNKHYKSKLPHTFDYLAPALFNGRYLTGVDEDSFFIWSMQDAKTREKKREEVKEERVRLEKLLGKDLTATSTFWETFSVELSADDDIIFNKSNPVHCLKYYMLLENGYVAPSIAVSGDPKYKDAKYYAFTEEGLNKDNVSIQKVKDKARAELLAISDNKDYLILIGQFLEGPKYTQKQDIDTLYTMLSSFIENPKEPKNRDKFVKALAKDREELQLRVIVDRAIRAKIIKVTNGYLQRGQVTLGKNVDEVYKKLSSPEFSNEFLSIKEELEG
jgi:hypothetical protein